MPEWAGEDIMRQLGTLATCLVMFTAAVWGQGATASLTGTVPDASGAVVPGTKVQIANVATGVTKETTTNQAGIFFVPDLISGVYNVEVTANGFRRKQVSGIRLEIDQK